MASTRPVSARTAVSNAQIGVYYEDVCTNRSDIAVATATKKVQIRAMTAMKRAQHFEWPWMKTLCV